MEYLTSRVAVCNSREIPTHEGTDVCLWYRFRHRCSFRRNRLATVQFLHRATIGITHRKICLDSTIVRFVYTFCAAIVIRRLRVSRVRLVAFNASSVRSRCVAISSFHHMQNTDDYGASVARRNPHVGIAKDTSYPVTTVHNHNHNHNHNQRRLTIAQLLFQTMVHIRVSIMLAYFMKIPHIWQGLPSMKRLLLCYSTTISL